MVADVRGSYRVRLLLDDGLLEVALFEVRWLEWAVELALLRTPSECEAKLHSVIRTKMSWLIGARLPSNLISNQKSVITGRRIAL